MDVWALVQELHTEQNPVERHSIRRRLASYLNELLVTNFALLVQLLYRVDVPEGKVKTVLGQNLGVDAGTLLADLLLERIEEKNKMLKTFRTPPPATDEESW